MYAVVSKGSQQLEVEVGQIYKVDKMDGEVGSEISFGDVLLVVDGDKRSIGQPTVKGAEVKAKIIGDAKGKKVISMKFRRRKASMTRKGHRQQYTLVKIEDIKV